jgi:hypothetical protein
MDILPENHDDLSVHEWDLVIDILDNLDLGPKTSKALHSLSIPALRELIAQSEEIAARQACLTAEALKRLEWLEN